MNLRPPQNYLMHWAPGIEPESISYTTTYKLAVEEGEIDLLVECISKNGSQSTLPPNNMHSALEIISCAWAGEVLKKITSNISPERIKIVLQIFVLEVLYFITNLLHQQKNDLIRPVSLLARQENLP